MEMSNLQITTLCKIKFFFSSRKLREFCKKSCQIVYFINFNWVCLRIQFFSWWFECKIKYNTFRLIKVDFWPQVSSVKRVNKILRAEFPHSFSQWWFFDCFIADFGVFGAISYFRCTRIMVQLKSNIDF